jgi:hypothetical protein
MDQHSPEFYTEATAAESLQAAAEVVQYIQSISITYNLYTLSQYLQHFNFYLLAICKAQDTGLVPLQCPL